MCGIYKERIGGNKKAAREIHLGKGYQDLGRGIQNRGIYKKMIKMD
jgi:hypothetical protein